MFKKDLLTYYNQELAFIRQLGVEFAAAHPKIAGRLNLDNRVVEDPHVSRLIEAFALMNARIQHKLDDGYAELINGLFNILYPHYLAPIPSMSIAHFDFTRQLSEKLTIPRHTMLHTNEIQGQRCNFRTVYPVTIWPIVVEAGVYESYKINSRLHLALNCVASGNSFTELAPPSLRFFINLPAQYAYKLYELLFNKVVQVVLSYNAENIAHQNGITLSNSVLQQVGFADDEGLLPYTARSFSGYRLLTDYFILPEKFLFFDLKFPDREIWQNFTDRLELDIYFNCSCVELTQQISINSLILGCTPIINLFTTKGEPIQLDHSKYEYQVIPDITNAEENTEIYAVKKVSAITNAGKIIDYMPLYGIKHHQQDQQHFWYASRKPAWHGEHYHDNGTSVFLTFADLNLTPLQEEELIISTDLLCTNRNLPERLPFGDDDLQIYLSAYSNELISRIHCIIPPTPAIYPSLCPDLSWRLISHLSLNHLSLTHGDNGADVLKELLNLYNFTDSADIHNMLQGIIKVNTKPVCIRNPRIPGEGFCQGIKIVMEVDESKFSTGGLFLFANVVEVFFSLYTTINSFIQLTVSSKTQEELYRCKPRTGTQTLF
jgi:type VI secretion system protein ImpG